MSTLIRLFTLKNFYHYHSLDPRGPRQRVSSLSEEVLHKTDEDLSALF